MCPIRFGNFVGESLERRLSQVASTVPRSTMANTSDEIDEVALNVLLAEDVDLPTALEAS